MRKLFDDLQPDGPDLTLGPVELRGMMERLRPELLDHPRYLALLEQHGIGDGWQRELCARAAALEPRTGVHINCLSLR